MDSIGKKSVGQQNFVSGKSRCTPQRLQCDCFLFCQAGFFFA